MATPKLKADRTGGPPRRTQAASKQPTAILVDPAGGPGPGAVAITVRPKTFRTLASQSGSVRALIESYSTALEQSRRSGRQVRFVVDVAPQGAATITPLEAPQPAE